MKIACFGVREIEKQYFDKLNHYQYVLTFIDEYMDENTVELAKGHDVVMIRGNCVANKEVLSKLEEYGIKYILTRTVGYNQIDLEEARQLGFNLCARVPIYSPTAISELAVSMALMLSRKTLLMLTQTSKKDFRIYSEYFSREIRHSTVGIIGMGRIGQCSAKAFIGMGAKVLGVDPNPSKEVKNLVTIVELETLLKESDIVLLHVPYIKGQNHHLVNHQFISKMKDNAILINTARGELVDTKAIIDGLQSNKLTGVGVDVLDNEKSYFGKNCVNDNNTLLNTINQLYPRLLITPHMGSFTDEALVNMIEISYHNLHNFITKGEKENCLL